MFKKLGINIPLLDVIMQVPQYTKFMKGLVTKKMSYWSRGIHLTDWRDLLTDGTPPKEAKGPKQFYHSLLNCYEQREVHGFV